LRRTVHVQRLARLPRTGFNLEVSEAGEEIGQRKDDAPRLRAAVPGAAASQERITASPRTSVVRSPVRKGGMNMRVISAPDAILPALERTRNLLFRPFRLGTYLKLCAVAVFTEGYASSFNSNLPGSHRATHIGPGDFPFHLTPVLIAVLVAVLLVVIVLAVLLFYVITRLRFAFFECLIRQSRLIRPGWRLYRQQTRRFFLLSIAIGLVFCAVSLVLAVPFLLGFWHLYRTVQSGGPFPVAGFLAMLLPMIPFILILALAGLAIDIVLRDFMLPHMALENSTAGQAWAAVRERMARHKGDFVLYVVLRAVLPVVAGIALVVVLAIPGLVFFAALVLAIGVVHAALAGAALILRLSIEGLLGLILFTLAVCLVLSAAGPLAVAVRSFALIFYGGRYQALGDILYPPAPPPAAAPAPL
jgi:hypothetical protein